MKFFKKFAAVLIAMAVFTVGNISILPRDAVEDFMLSVRAADSDIVASGECGAQGDNLTWTLYSDGTLTISGEGEMTGWTSLSGVQWFSYRENIVKVTIEKGIKSIGDNAFYNCSTLTSITIPNGVTCIGDSAFSHCESLTSITIPDSVTSIGESAFSECYNLTFITIPDSVTSIGYCAFWETSWFEAKQKENPLVIVNGILIDGHACTDTVIIPDSVTSIGVFAFSNCKSLTSITIPDSVTSIGNSAFSYCDSLTSITIPDSVTSIEGRVFYRTQWLEIKRKENPLVIVNGILIDGYICSGDVVIPDSVTSIGVSAFSNCKSLTSITIPDSVTSIGDNVFYNCFALTSITIPDSVTSIGNYAFSGCENLTSITIPDSVTSIGNYAFSGCENLTSIKIPNSVTCIDEETFSGCAALTSITIPDSVTSIGNYAFSDCSSLVEITIPDSVTSIEKNAFSNCNALTTLIIANGSQTVTHTMTNGLEKHIQEVVIPDSVTSIGNYAFSGCENLTSITIPDSVTSIGNYAFSGCENLTSIKIPNSVTCIDEETFSGCAALTSITIPDSVTSIGNGAFRKCCNLTFIIIPDSVTSIGNGAFYHCCSLTLITIPDSVTSIGMSAFSGCDSLTSITIPDSVTSIEAYAFSDCNTLTTLIIANGSQTVTHTMTNGLEKHIQEVVIPDSVTSIGNYAFTDYENLTSITIPDSVTSIGNYAFSNCENLTSIKIPSSVTSHNNIGLDDCYNLTDIIRPRIKNYSFTDNINEETILADVTPVKLNRHLYNTYDKETGYFLGGDLDRLQEVCTVSGEIYAVYGDKDDVVIIPKNESLQSLEIRNEGYTFGAATIGDDDYLYVMWGKSISDDIIDESLYVENIVISKYDLKGNFIDEYGLSVDFTDAQFPFNAGNANIKYNNGIIGVFYDTELTGTVHHQCSSFVSIDATLMELVDFDWLVTSHSFGVSMIATENGFAAIDRGDANPRGINFTQFTTQGISSTVCFHSSGKYAESGSHQNDTHTYMGGLAKSASTYAITGKSERFYTSGNYAESNLSAGNYDVFVRIVDRTLYDIAATDCAGENRINIATGEIADRNVVWLTECNETEKAGNVKIVTLEDGSYCVLWEKIVDNEFDSIQYVILDECGNILRRQSTIYGARLSNTSIQPIVQGDTLTWAVSDSRTNEIVWYTVDLNEYRTEPIYLLGDVNEDGSVDSSDASKVLAEYAKIQTGGAGEFTDIQYKAADVNNDGVVDSSDTSKILAYYAMVSTGKKPTWD